MNKTKTRHEFAIQLVALLVIVVLVHLSYQWIIRPRAAEAMKAAAELKKTDPTVDAPVSIAVIVKDIEQEACTVLFFWALSIIP